MPNPSHSKFIKFNAHTSPSNSWTGLYFLLAANSTPHCGRISFTNWGNSHDFFKEQPYLWIYSEGLAQITPKCLISFLIQTSGVSHWMIKFFGGHTTGSGGAAWKTTFTTITNY